MIGCELGRNWRTVHHMVPWSLREVSHFGPLPHKQVAARDPNMPTWNVRDAPEIRRCSEKETTVGGIHDGNLAAERAVAEMFSCCLGTQAVEQQSAFVVGGGRHDPQPHPARPLFE